MAALTNLIERTGSIVPVGTVNPGQESSSGPVTVPVYQVQSFAPQVETGQLQKLYGTSAMPMFEFARRVQSGESTFDPSKQFDREAADVIGSLSDEELAAQGLEPDLIKDILIPTASTATGAVLGTAGRMASALPGGGTSSEFLGQIGPAAGSYLPGSSGSGLTVGSGVNKATAAAFGLKPGQSAIRVSDFNTIQSSNPMFSGTPLPGNQNLMSVNTASLNQQVAAGAAQPGGVVASQAADPGMFDAGGFFDKGFTRYTPSFAQVGVGFGLDLGFNLLSGMKPKEAVKSAAITTAGTAIGTAVAGPIGGFVGGTIAKVISGGSVVCTELHEQGEISDSEYRTTNYYNATVLTPTHMKGYHFWGVPVAEKMKKGKQIKFWKFVYKQWSKHAHYKLGKRKFSLSGFVVAKSLETASLLIGKIYEATLEKRIFAHG
tara:strand:- start:3101 stop:4399 length:1299 start_codon:yes stop_codon:yes gene_type:complete